MLGLIITFDVGYRLIITPILLYLARKRGDGRKTIDLDYFVGTNESLLLTISFDQVQFAYETKYSVRECRANK